MTKNENEIIGRGGGMGTMSQEEAIAHWDRFREKFNRNRRQEQTKPETEEILPTSSAPLPDRKSHDLRGG